MRMRLLLLCLGVAAVAAAPAPAGAVVHTVQPGESLYSIAAADGLSVPQLAAANGVSTGGPLLVGTNLTIPPQSTAATSSPASRVDGDGDTDGDTPVATAGSSGLGAGPSSSTGSYVVAPGDTLWSIAHTEALTAAQRKLNTIEDQMRAAQTHEPSPVERPAAAGDALPASSAKSASPPPSRPSAAASAAAWSPAARTAHQPPCPPALSPGPRLRP